MNARKIIGKIIFGLLITICTLSFALFLYFTELLDIQKIVLKEGIFKVIDEEHEFEFDKLRNKPFDIIVRFYKGEGTNYSSLFSDQVPYAIDIELRDHKNGVIKRDTFAHGNFMPKSFTNKYFEWTLMQFNAQKGGKYKVKFIFNSDYKQFDTMKKEFYVQQYYDPPSKPWWHLFQLIFLIIFVITFLPILIISLLYWRRKRRK